MTASTVRLKSTVRLPLASEPVKVMVYGICGVEFEVVTVNPAVPGATTEMEDGWQTGPSVSTGDTAHDSATVGVVANRRQGKYREQQAKHDCAHCLPGIHH